MLSPSFFHYSLTEKKCHFSLGAVLIYAMHIPKKGGTLMRADHDLLGEIYVPDTAYYGGQTQRALDLGDMAPMKLADYPELIRAMTAIKKAYAITHKELGVLAPEKADAICRAADEVLSGEYSDQFPVDIIAGGGGVAINMNVNEVLANRANEILTGKKGDSAVHGNTHVNMGQSTNDTLPSAMKLALGSDLKRVIDAVKTVRDAYESKAAEYRDTVKVSRTCIQDAVPMTFGQFFGAAASFLTRQIEELAALLPSCFAIPLGATAVGTGLNSYAGYEKIVFPALSEILGKTIAQEENLFDGLQFGDIYVKASGALKALATGLSKMGRDLRLLSSGPRSGLMEITIAPMQNGSSIMPGKVNPALPELMNVVAYHVVGADAAVTMAVEGGELELNVWEPVIIVNLLGAAKVLANAMPLFATRCVATITVNQERCLADAEKSLASAAVVSALVGYKKGTQVAHLASEKNLTIKEAAVLSGYLTREEAERFLDPVMLTDSRRSGKLLLDISLKEHRIR